MRYNEEFNKDIPVRLCTTLGGGCGYGGMCGVMTAAALIIGLEKGRDDSTGNKLESREYFKKYIEIMLEKFGEDQCRELKAKEVSCPELMDTSYEVVTDILGKEIKKEPVKSKRILLGSDLQILK